MAGGWASLGLMDELVKAAEIDFDWDLPTAVQDECIPLILGGGDVMASAETGSGKTAAFALPILQLCHEYKLAHDVDARAPHKSGDAINKQPPEPLNFEMSYKDRDKSISIDPDSAGLMIQTRDVREWAGCRCSAGVACAPENAVKNTGIGYYYECTIRDEGIVRIGFSTPDAKLDLGTDDMGWGYGGTGVKAHNDTFEAYPDDDTSIIFEKGDVIGCSIEFDDKTSESLGSISFYKNGVHLGKAFDLPNTTPLELFPTIAMKNAECQLNFGGDGMASFRFPPTAMEHYLPFAAVTLENGGVTNPRCPMSSTSPTILEGPLAIVIEPSRDLAEQTYNVFVEFANRISSPTVEPVLLLGGVSTKTALDKCRRNKVDFLIGTPKIIATYMKKGKIKTARCKMFILDETDQIVRNDDVQHIHLIFSRLPNGESEFDRLQVCFFSATLRSREVQNLAAKICHRPLWIDLRGKNESIVPKTVYHCLVHVNPTSFSEAKDSVVTDAVHRGGELEAKTIMTKLPPDELNSEKIKLMKPNIVVALIEKFEMKQVLVFCRTNLDCDLMETYIKAVGERGGATINKRSCRVLAASRSMKERQSSLKAFKKGDVRILIATDVAARGIDIKELPFVINVNLPDKPDTYIHRVGRVGRAQRLGCAISIVSEVKEMVWFCQGGIKPPCKDTRLYDEGGNCIWYDEPMYLKKIQKLLQKNKIGMTNLQWPELNVPAEMAAIIDGEAYGDFAGGSAMDPELEKHMSQISDKINLIAMTEFSLQSQFWKIQNRF